MNRPIIYTVFLIAFSLDAVSLLTAGAPLPGTEPLELTGEIDRHLIAGVSRFLDAKLAASVNQRERHWQRDFSSAAAYTRSLQPNRERLAHILGVRDVRPSSITMELMATTEQTAKVGEGVNFTVSAVRWPAFGDVYGEGLLLRPADGAKPLANVVAVPDADQTPEQIVGLVEGVALESQFARVLAGSGCQVLVPTLVSRQRGQIEWSGHRPDLTNREFLYRSAFELGRHIIGYEVQKILAGVDWFQQQNAETPVVVVGWGEGGMLALFAGALDARIDATCVSGFFAPRESVWRQPIDRNVFGLLEQFGDAELAAMIAPRALIVEAARGPELTLSGGPGAPATLTTPEVAAVQAEYDRAQGLVQRLSPAPAWSFVRSGPDGRGPFGSRQALATLLENLSPEAKLVDSHQPPMHVRSDFDTTARLHRQMGQMDRHSQSVLRESPYVRQQLTSRLNTDSLEAYEESSREYREMFASEVIGRFDDELLPAKPRTREAYDEAKWTGYEVVLDVYPEVIAYGLLLLPKDLEPGEKRPVVVCQHGLEGRPQDTIGEASYQYYKAFAARLAERGFITFAPQNLYRHQDEFRVLQRKANPLKKTLFSIITPQHQQIVDWLQTLPFVDGQRIGFYGLSYGGKTAMRVPALVTDYCLSICSADFNEWVDKNASTRNPRSYVWSGEYEIFEFDLGSTFNYAEMAALIAPRPFMVERGHFDGVADDETVAYEFAKVRHLYAARLKIPDRCEIEWFDGPHTINGQGTFDFLHRHLQWEKP